MKTRWLLAWVGLLSTVLVHGEPELLVTPGAPLAGTEALAASGDLASNMVAGVDRFLDRQLAEAALARERECRESSTNATTWATLVSTNRARLAGILGVVDARSESAVLQYLASSAQPSLVATSRWVRVEAVRWPAFRDVSGEGLLLTPSDGDWVADVVAVPDADVTPEQLAGVESGVAPESQFARRLAESGCRVLVPYLVNRNKGESKVAWDPDRARKLPNREFLHRAAFEMGRTLAGYEVAKILAGAEALKDAANERPLGVVGWGEGGRLALFAGALEPRFASVGVSGAFGPRERSWEEPLDRNLFGVLEHLGDAELTALILPRTLVVEAAAGPQVVQPSDGGAPSRLTNILVQAVRQEVAKARRILTGARSGSEHLRLLESGGGTGAYGSEACLAAFLEGLRTDAAPVVRAPGTSEMRDLRTAPEVQQRAARQFHEIDRHTQQLLTEAAYVRQDFLKGMDTSTPEKLAANQATYREFFADRVIGRYPGALSPLQARSRKSHDDPKWSGYEVTMEVFPDVFAYGLLLLPKDLKEGERRPVVVCQHGLEGRPQDTIGKAGYEYYSAFAARLAERGFVTFAPQNPYIFHDRFRQLQRKSNPVGKTLFSVIVPQHQQIVNWLKTQQFVDPQRIAFYGLSYGGKTAMRVPALVTDYCLSICSADFNEWVWKNASTRSPHSYVWTGEYEIFEWNLGHTFNYAEMASLIAPRPFMVERGHFDGVAPDEAVGYEFAKVQYFYAARLKRPAEDCQIEWFVGPHTIHGVGTYEFLHRHLQWPAPAK